MRVIQKVTNCVVIKNQSQYSLTDLEPPPCELSNDVGINLLGRSLQEIWVFPTSSLNIRTDIREVAQRTRRLESKGCNIMLVPSIVSSSESPKHCRCMKSWFVH